MIPVADFSNVVQYIRDPGYSSVYSFSEEDAAKIKESGHSRGFDQYTPGSDVLPIDLDDGGVTLDKVLERLDGYAYELWSSGGKGHHIILKHDFIQHKDLPYSHSQVVKSLGVGCDMTLYQAGRILSLPGRIHQKTGRKKTLLSVVAGKKIDVPIIAKPLVEFSFCLPTEGDYKAALARLWSLAEEGLEEGQRNKKIWQTASSLITAGFDVEATFLFMLHINNQQPQPLEEEEVKQAVLSAGRRGR
jgi:hypothetical protein